MSVFAIYESSQTAELALGHSYFHVFTNDIPLGLCLQEASG